jgi:glutathione S-transferase
LARKFDLYGKLTSTNKDPVLLEGYINGVVTCAYTDVIIHAILCLWSTPDIENNDIPRYNPIKRIQNGLESLNTLLKQSSTSFFYDQKEPTIADYFAFEAYSIIRDIHPKFLSNNCDALVKLEQAMKERPALANYFKNGRLFKRFCGSPYEDGYLASLAKIK